MEPRELMEVEVWALRALQAANAGEFVEDSRLELKAEWPDPKKAARRLAGHANAARGARILWLIGVDEKRGVLGAKFQEFSSWHAQVEAEFDGLAPTVIHLNIPFESVTVSALCFATDRAPYVVKNVARKNEGAGPVSLEVPWREGTRTRTAARADLIQILVPTLLSPTLEFLGGELEQTPFATADPSIQILSAHVEFYIAPQTERIIVFPFHKLSATAVSAQGNFSLQFDHIRFTDGSAPSAYSVLRSVSPISQPQMTVNARVEPVEITESELIVRGPRKLITYASADLPDAANEKILEWRFNLSLISAVGDVRCAIAAKFNRRADGSSGLPAWDAIL
jgi:hypothetical protein